MSAFPEDGRLKACRLPVTLKHLVVKIRFSSENSLLNSEK